MIELLTGIGSRKNTGLVGRYEFNVLVGGLEMSNSCVIKYLEFIDV